MQPNDAFDAETWVSASKCERKSSIRRSRPEAGQPLDADGWRSNRWKPSFRYFFRSTRAANLAAGRDRNGTGLDDDQIRHADPVGTRNRGGGFGFQQFDAVGEFVVRLLPPL